jgi:hypothetical protein
MQQNQMQHTGPMMGQSKVASGINVLLGLWVIISPWIFGLSGNMSALWNSIIVGVVVAILAGIRFANASENVWLSWVNLVLGVWVIATPWIYSLTTDMAAMTNYIIVGILIAALAIWSALASRPGQAT